MKIFRYIFGVIIIVSIYVILPAFGGDGPQTDSAFVTLIFSVIGLFLSFFLNRIHQFKKNLRFTSTVNWNIDVNLWFRNLETPH